MGKTSLCAIVCMIMLGVVVPAVAQDTSLVGWWKMDGDGSDASGSGRDGVLEGDAHFAPGYRDQALALDGDGDYFTVTDYKGLMSSSPITVTAWVQTTGNGDMVFWGRTGAGRRVEFRVNGGRVRIDNGRGNIQGDTTMNDGEWHHVTVTIPVDAEISYPFVKVYLNGEDDSRAAVDPQNHTFRLVEHDANFDVIIGGRDGWDDKRHFPGLIDDVRIYEAVLLEAEIKDIMNYGYFASAHSPGPANGGKFEERFALLEWVPGALAESHNLYFGTSFEDVNAVAEDVFVDNITGTVQAVGVKDNPAPEGLVPGTTYYWRVDPVNESHPDSPWRGEVWSFWIPPVTAYDPFPADGEPFEDPNVTLTWSPGLKAIYGTVYFGTDANVVATETGGVPIMEYTYDPPDLLDPETTYYWRADTFSGAEWVTGPMWSFTTMPEIQAVDPNLILWYNFDEGAGSNVVDWSGHGNHGALFGPQWTDAGVVGDGALAFDAAGQQYVAIRNLYYEDANYPEVTVCAWVRTSDPNHQVIATFDRNEFWRLEINTETVSSPLGPGRVGWDAMTFSGDEQVDTGSAFRVDDGQWHHLCGVFDNGLMTTYIDGRPERSVTGGETFGDEILRYGFLGVGSEATEFNGTHTPADYFNGDMDDVRIYDRALTQAEIVELTRTDPLSAWDFQPRMNRVFEIGTLTSLSWKPGEGAAEYDVYLGTDADAVAAADTSDVTGVYCGRQNGTTYAPPEGFAWGTTYYWRIDTVGADGTVTKGRVLTFTIADYLVVEDFESYTNDSPNRLFQTWTDGLGFSPDEHFPDGHPGNGTGAAVGNDIWSEGTTHTWIAERRVVYDGGQSMPIDYNNVNPPYYSETERLWSTPQNWNVEGVDTLTLYYTAGALTDPNVQGLADLYVAIQDSAGVTAVATHPDPNAVRQIEWQRWDIPLADLAAAGVNTGTVEKMRIGLGNRNAPLPDGAGVIYIDAIRLTKP